MMQATIQQLKTSSHSEAQVNSIFLEYKLEQKDVLSQDKGLGAQALIMIDRMRQL